MTYSLIYTPKPPHVCDKPKWPDHGIIIQCNDCGQYWRYTISTKTNYAGWDLATKDTVDQARKGLLT